jgi:hypothetical protein
MALTGEWYATKDTIHVCAAKTVEHWLPPDEGWVKLNADGAFYRGAWRKGCGHS